METDDYDLFVDSLTQGQRNRLLAGQPLTPPAKRQAQQQKEKEKKHPVISTFAYLAWASFMWSFWFIGITLWAIGEVMVLASEHVTHYKLR